MSPTPTLKTSHSSSKSQAPYHRSSKSVRGTCLWKNEQWLKLFDPKEDDMIRYVEEMHGFVEDGKLATCSRRAQGVVEYDREGLGFERFIVALREGHLKPKPYCPHIFNENREASWCRLHPVRRKPGDMTKCVGYLKANTHQCAFVGSYLSNLSALLQFPFQVLGLENIALIQPMAQRLGWIFLEGRSTGVIMLKMKAKRLVAANSDEEADMLAYAVKLSRDSEAPLDTRAGSSQNCQPSPSSSKSLSPSWKARARLAPRKSHPGSTQSCSFYTLEVAEQRKKSDEKMLENLFKSFQSGEYIANPSAHPAWNTAVLKDLPSVLHQYHLTFDDGGGAFAQGILQLVQPHLYTEVGRIIVLLNTRGGLERDLCNLLFKHSFRCICCQCYFSEPGYYAHAGYFSETCSNHPDHGLAYNLEEVVSTLPKLIAPANAEVGPFTASEIALSPLGLAWLAWNSKAGIPGDAWHLISTAYKYCPYCNRVRSFDAHRAHMDGDSCGIKQTGEDGDEGGNPSE
ncbi:hypothetical protein K435DRAFT_806717 [Dendrothele bispora CBS 962.96]|uniref:Uncharacterized protein n=1 Tax=Dendrothele bispora (strain CBS 962.96) TaxID=1314807 RepID=A0A4V6T535_DENBC|nr:hypothetical protein K435DRAFT_806717 [Dendrothele bispora CBS 962.96]